MKKFNYIQRGVGLLEILIALAISAIMLLAITNMYGIFMQTSSQQKEQSIIQDQANYAFLALKRAVRMSGAGLCVNPIEKSKTFLHQEQEFDYLPYFLVKELEEIAKVGADPADPQKIKREQERLVKLTSTTRLYSYQFTGFKKTDEENVSKILYKIEEADDRYNGKEFNLEELPFLGELEAQKLKLTPNSEILLTIYSDSDTRRIIGIQGVTGLSTPSSPHQTRILSDENSNLNDLVFYDHMMSKDKDEKLFTWVAISDCEHTGIFKYTPKDFEGITKGKLPPPKDNKYGFIYNFIGNDQTNQFSLISRLHAKLFFVAKNEAGISSLYSWDFLDPNGRPEPVAAYVEKMEIYYLNPKVKRDDKDNPKLKLREEQVWLTSDQWKEYLKEKSLENWDKELSIRINLDMAIDNKREKKDDSNKDNVEIFSRVLNVRN